MSGQVIERLGYTIDDAGIIHYDDRVLTWAEGDERAGFRLDRRCSHAFIDNELQEICRYTARCSGCGDENPYSFAQRGSGCRECGYQGVIRHHIWVPSSRSERQRGAS